MRTGSHTARTAKSSSLSIPYRDAAIVAASESAIERVLTRAVDAVRCVGKRIVREDGIRSGSA